MGMNIYLENSSLSAAYILRYRARRSAAKDRCAASGSHTSIVAGDLHTCVTFSFVTANRASRAAPKAPPTSPPCALLLRAVFHRVLSVLNGVVQRCLNIRLRTREHLLQRNTEVVADIRPLRA